jgi:ABC-type phosphate/phosphonate transport system substrate-binding protein
MKLGFAILALALAAGLATTGACAANPQATSDHATVQRYTLGVFPYMTPLRLEGIYAPIGAAFAETLGAPVSFRTAPDFDKFYSRLEAGRYDIALIQPFWYGPAVDRFGYRPLARIEEPLTAQIVVLEDSPLLKCKELRGRTLATPPPRGPVTLLALEALKQNGLAPHEDVEIKAYKSVESCLQQVAARAADACVTGPLAPRMLAEKQGIRFRALLETPDVPNLTFVVHSRVSDDEAARLQKAMLAWNKDDAGMALLAGMKTRRLITVGENDYEQIRSMALEVQYQ